ncbi:MAG: hypothetical protein LBU99_06210 [Spirochaetaceae bacterium]|jgi:hypothetical protein|nr:hypothetical protein [Spirochaetaceae bacterium]
MRRNGNSRFFEAVCVIGVLLFFAFPLSGESSLDGQLKILLAEFSEQIEEAGISIQEFESLLISDSDRPYEMEVLRLYLEKKIGDLKQSAGAEDGAAAVVGKKTERIGSGGTTPRGIRVTASVQEREDSVDISVSFPRTAKTSIRLAKEPDLIALLGQEYTDSRYASAGGGELFSLVVRGADGSAYPVRRVNGRSVITVQRGTGYRIVLENRLSEEISAAVFVDGINTILQGRELPSTGYKWVVDSNSRFVLPGWQHDNSRVSSFIFTDSGSGAAARLGYGESPGVITAVFYVQEKEPERSQGNYSLGNRGVGNSAAVRSIGAATGYGEAASGSVQEVYTENVKRAVRIIQLWYEFDR